MNILQLVSGSDVNGAVVHCRLLTQALMGRGHRITAIVRPNSWIGKQFRADGICLIESDMERWPPGELRRIAARVRAERMDVLHTHMTRADNFGIFLRWLTGVPCVTTAHAHTIHPHWRLADYVIAVSDATRRYHRRFNLVPKDRIETVRNFVDYERFARPRPDARARIRTEWGLDEGTPIIGCVGDVTRRKGQLYLVRALRKIREAIASDVRLALIGYGHRDYVARVRAEAARLGVSHCLVWAGYRKDVPEVMAALDVYALPSLVEPFGMVAAEAMAAGLPVVGTRVGGVPEFVRPGETGLLVPPADPDALAEAATSLLRRGEGERRAMGARGRDWVRENFTLERQVPRIEAVLARVADAHAARRPS